MAVAAVALVLNKCMKNGETCYAFHIKFPYYSPTCPTTTVFCTTSNSENEGWLRRKQREMAFPIYEALLHLIFFLSESLRFLMVFFTLAFFYLLKSASFQNWMQFKRFNWSWNQVQKWNFEKCIIPTAMILFELLPRNVHTIRPRHHLWQQQKLQSGSVS